VLPDYAMLIINASDGVTRGSVTGKDKFEEVNMTKEHWAVICALQIPLIIILTKMDLVPADMYEKNKTILHKYMKAAKRKPMHINNNQDVEELFKIDALLNTYSPIVSISAKSGHNIALLHHLLSNLKPVPLADWTNFMDSTLAETDEKKHTSTAVFSIDDDFEVENTGLVVSGVVTNGQIKAKNVMWLGPLAGADKDYPMVRPVQKLEFPYHFIPVVLKSIEKHRTLYEDWVGKGSNCAIAIRPENRKYDLKRAQIHPGMFLFDHSIVPTATTVFEAKVHILHHATMIKVGYQAVIFIGMSTQTVSVLDIKDEKGEESLPLLHTGDKARVVFQFNARAESLHEEMPFVFRESHTKGTGVVLKSEFTIDELEKILKTYRVSKQVRAMLQRDQKARS
jgi:elongation factor 1-alpha